MKRIILIFAFALFCAKAFTQPSSRQIDSLIHLAFIDERESEPVYVKLKDTVKVILLVSDTARLFHNSHYISFDSVSNDSLGRHWVFNGIIDTVYGGYDNEAKEFICDVMHMRSQFGSEPFNFKIEKGFLSIKLSDITGTAVIIKNWGKEGTGEWVFNCSYSMNDVMWLVKKGFDVFGLLECNLAVTETDIQPQP